MSHRLRPMFGLALWGHDDLTRLVVVSADGTFQFPLVGDVAVGGLTPGEIGAVTVAGGFTEKAGQSPAKLIRRTASGQEQTVALDLSGADPAARDFPSGTAIRS
jgi:protein involved in polysaccharide export with SLBB domain